MSRLLFLDVDGVLTTTLCPNEMVPSCVERLDRILAATGAALVISSSWRATGIGPDSELQTGLRRICREMDGHLERFERIASRLHGATARMPSGTRQDEIEQYVRVHRPQRYAAVDDWPREFASPAPGWLVLTDAAQGLDPEAEARLIELLSSPR